MPDVVVHVGGRTDPLVLRINGKDPNFILRTDTIEAQALRDLDPVLLDLLDIAAAVFAADGSITRGGDTRTGMGAGWRRSFRFEIPVRDPDLWSRPDVVAALVRAVHVLTDDEVSFAFSQSRDPPSRDPYLALTPTGPAGGADEVVLFSGGLDSYAGALELLSVSSSRLILVSHRSAQKVIPRQRDLGQYLDERFPGRLLHVHALARRVGREAADTTQRSRSFLFAALGQAVARTFGARRVSFFENGIVSHNLPLNHQSVGTMATRTTHPLALCRLNDLMSLVIDDPAPIRNAYEWLTKTEVVSRIASHGGKERIARAVSCTSVREQNGLQTHCGACTQCLDRRFALLAAGLAEHDPEEIYLTDVLLGARETVRSQTLALDWTRHSLRFGSLDERSLMETFGLEAMRIAQGHPDLDRRDALGRTLEMHRRHSEAVQSVLEDMLRDRATDLVGQRLPETSLLCMHVGNRPLGDVRLPTDPRATAAEVPPIGNVMEEDIVFQPGAPLQVAFIQEDGKPVVTVRGLGRLEGGLAAVPVGLKDKFVADREAGMPPEKHRYCPPGELPLPGQRSKQAIRKLVERCRRSLAGDYQLIVGEPPSKPLLVESRSPWGYRLDPTILVLKDDLREKCHVVTENVTS